MSSVGIMFDLDAILDTRLGNIKLNLPKIFDEIKESPKYYLRKNDDWGNIHPDINNNLLTLNYQGRDLETIKSSQLTVVIRSIIDTVTSLKQAILSGDPEITDFFFVLNIHPYKIDEDTLIELARYAVHQIGYPDVKVGFVDLPFEKITLEYLRDNNILHWYCYHYQQWLYSQFDGITSAEDEKKIKGFAECKLYCPKILFNQTKIDELMDSVLEEVDIDQFEMTKIAFSSIININFLPVSVFSRLDIQKLIVTEQGESVERSNVINIFYNAVEEIKFRLGEEKLIGSKLVDNRLKTLEGRIAELQGLNQPATLSLFRMKLAEFMIEAANIYNATPFNAGEDLEQTLNHMSLQIDVTVEEFLLTENHWNAQGFRTIRQEHRLPSGELIYRCLDADTGLLLSPFKQIKLKLSAIDDLILGNYLQVNSNGTNGA